MLFTAMVQMQLCHACDGFGNSNTLHAPFLTFYCTYPPAPCYLYSLADFSKADAKAELKDGEGLRDLTIPVLSRSRPNPQLCSSDVREELLDTMLLYNVPCIRHAAAASKARRKNET